MAIAKKQRQEEGCPAWLATYGDMVTNLLVFFVLMLSMSEVKQDEQFIEFMQAIRDAFGYVGGLKTVHYDEVFQPKNVPLAEFFVVPVNPERVAQSPDRGIRDEHSTVTDIRHADHFNRGGSFHFAELSAEIDPDIRDRVAEYAERHLRGHRTQIEIRGHCNPRPVTDTEFADHYALAYARTRAVADVLIDAGIAADRLILVSAGPNEPVTTGAYTGAQRQENDIVEIRELNKRVEEFETGEDAFPLQ
jgi:chemotaxis protein MotB